MVRPLSRYSISVQVISQIERWKLDQKSNLISYSLEKNCMKSPVAPFLTQTATVESKTRARYLEYLKSDHWKEKKIKLFETWKICQLCGSKKYLQVHHKNYRNLYNEEVEKDLVVLCSFCHNKLHKEYWNREHLSQSLEVFTDIKISQSPFFIYQKRKPKKKSISSRQRKIKISIQKSKQIEKRVTREFYKSNNPNWNPVLKKFEYTPYQNVPPRKIVNNRLWKIKKKVVDNIWL